MIYKISPHPSLLKRGKERENFAKEGERKGRNDPLDSTKTLNLFITNHESPITITEN